MLHVFNVWYTSTSSNLASAAATDKTASMGQFQACMMPTHQCRFFLHTSPDARAAAPLEHKHIHGQLPTFGRLLL
jgi:hypothetical protein